MNRILEACCTSPSEVKEAILNGADRIELCEQIEVGGVTPCEDNIRQSVALGLPVNVLIRPRGGNFVFNQDEIGQMLESIELCRRLGAKGVVIGALKEDGTIDMEAMKRMMAQAKKERPMNVTFHRAFDRVAEPEKALEQIIELGCDHILTSGQKDSAMEGAELIAQLVTQASGRITVMPGAGVNPSNIDKLQTQTKAVEFHGTKICSRNF